MVGEYVHGIVIEEGTGELRRFTTGAQDVIGLVGTAPHSTVLEKNTPKVYFSKKTALKDIKGEASDSVIDKGSLYQSINDIYSQGNHTVVIVKAASDNQEDIITAIEALADAESVTSYKPKILCAPGHLGSIPQAVTVTLSSKTKSSKKEVISNS